MALDGKLLAQARKELEYIRQQNEALQAHRLAEIYAHIPDVQEIDTSLRRQMVQLSRITLARGKTMAEDLAVLEAENLRFQKKRRELLKTSGYPEDYTNEIFTCPHCRDTGYVNGAMCQCLQRLYNAQVTAALSGLLRGDERFEQFSLQYYPDIPDETGNVPRECMAIIRDFCQAYAQQFDRQGPNLVFSGGPGLGKTFLSACIAREVSQRGFSVAYDSVTTALNAFEREKFLRDEEKSAAGAVVSQYLSCDLMILDDLGTEMITPFTLSALYTLIDRRLSDGKQTIISTNLTEKELERQYTAQIASRLLGCYQWLHFLGNDIRRM